MKSLFVVGVLFFASALRGDLSQELMQHLRTNFNDAEMFSGIVGIDKIYVINLDHKKERKKWMHTLLTSHGLGYERFPAINGWALDKKDLRHFYLFCLTSPRDRKKISPGQMGCFLSHLSIIHHALEQGYEAIWILEDDVVFNHDPKETLSRFLQETKDKGIAWEVLYTDLNLRSFRSDGSMVDEIVFEGSLGKDFDYASAGSIEWVQPVSMAKQMHHRLGTYSMVLSKRGMQKIWDYFTTHPMISAYDVDLNFLENTKFFQLLEDVVTTNGFESSTSTQS